MAGVIKVVSELGFDERHFRQMRRTPFWLMFEAIIINKPDFNEYRKCDDLVVKILRTFSLRDDAFYVGGVPVKVCKADIRLVFGLQCGDQQMDLTPGTRPASDFIQRRCNGVGRITASLIKSLLDDAVKGNSKRDEEDTAKLLCLYVCVKLFFSTSGETISWVFVRYLDNLDNVQNYDWTGAIVNTLMGSVREFWQTPDKVTGCVVALLYWLCEHTNIVSTTKPIMFPRFLKWNISILLAKTRCLDLGDVSQFQVIRGKLVSQPFEKVILAGEEFDGGEDANIDEDREVGGEYSSNGSDDFCNDNGARIDHNMGVCGNKVVGGVRVAAKRNVKGSGDRRRFVGEGGVVGKGKTCVAVDVVSSPEGNVGGIVCATHVERIGDGKGELETALAELYTLRVECRAKDGMIAELQAEVERLRRTKEKQAVDIVGGFTLVFKVKEDEMKKVAEENVELRRTIGVLEEQLAQQDVHNVTQAYRKVDDGDTGMTEGNDDGSMEGRTLDSFGQRGNYVLRKSGMLRKDVVKPDFDYGGVGKMMDVVRTCVRSGNAGRSIDVDACAVSSREWSGFDLNNRLGVWKLMTAGEKEKIRNAYDKDGDRTVMWASSGHGVCVCFVDIKSLVRPSSMRGNVIDAYAVLLMEEQDRLSVGVDFPDKSYVFSSICLEMLKNDNSNARDRFVLDNFAACKDCRYVHFPICFRAHWTLVVYDTETGIWKHYNSMRPRVGIEDKHLKEAVFLRDTVIEIQRGAIGVLGDDDATQCGQLGVESVTDCPQQKHDSEDCAIIVCAVMRQYVHHVDVNRSLQGDNCVILRANMVKGFVNDNERGLKDGA